MRQLVWGKDERREVATMTMKQRRQDADGRNQAYAGEKQDIRKYIQRLGLIALMRHLCCELALMRRRSLK
jgi:hypothetical protein